MEAKRTIVLLFQAMVIMFTSLSSAYADNVDANQYGFSPTSSGKQNRECLQKAVDRGGTIVINKPGEYLLGGTVYIGDNTKLIFGKNVKIKKDNNVSQFTHTFLNKGALDRTYNKNITIDGLEIVVNGVDKQRTEVYGLRGQLAFFYVKNLVIRNFKCLDLGSSQFAIHICTFQNISIEDVQIKGDKDGIHLGRGSHFVIKNCSFQTKDDAIALNAHDYATSNPELGDITDGIIENCTDMADSSKLVGYFCRILGGAWSDWHQGMKVRNSDTVVSDGRLYRVHAKADGQEFVSNQKPAHHSGSQVIDGINWEMVQDDVTYSACVRNIVFRNVFLKKARPAFSIHFDNDNYSRSYYPGSKIPCQRNLKMENVQVLYPENSDFIMISMPVDHICLTNCMLYNNSIHFLDNHRVLDNYLDTRIEIYKCRFMADKLLKILSVAQNVNGKNISFITKGSKIEHDTFTAMVSEGSSKVFIDSDLPGLAIK